MPGLPDLVRRFGAAIEPNNSLQPGAHPVDIRDMNTLHHLLPRWATRSPAGRDSGFSHWLRSTFGGPACAQHSRVEVCPPALWPSSLTFWGRARRWLERSPWMPDDHRPVNRLALVKREFRSSLQALDGADAAALRDRIDRARSLRELWHLRSMLYGQLAIAFSQVEAERQMAQLNRHFPTRAPRAGGPTVLH
jgi:hypothetical protein